MPIQYVEQEQSAKPPLFLDTLPSAQQHLLLSQGTRVTYPAQSTLFTEGDSLEYVYLIRKGKVKLSKMTEEGREITIHLKQGGEFVGDVILFNEMPVNITAVTTNESELIRYTQSDLEDIFEQDGRLATTYIKWYSREMQTMEAKMRDLLLFGKQGALYSTLIRFSNSYGQKKRAAASKLRFV